MRRDFDRHKLAVRQNGLGKRTEATLTGDFRLGAALRLIGQIKIFKLGLGCDACDLQLQLRRQFSLTANRFQDRSATGFQFAQIGEAFGKLAQLRIVKAAGDFLR